MNFDGNPVKFRVHIDGADPKSLDMVKTELTSGDVKDENSLDEPIKVLQCHSVVWEKN